MKKFIIFVLILAFSTTFSVLPSEAQRDFSMDIIKAGLIGAGAGAIGGAASGAKGRDIWKGALAGAGTNIVGGALLDMITQQNTSMRTQRYYAQQPQYYYVQPQRSYATYSQPARYSQPQCTTMNSTQGESFDDIFQRGYYLGYKEGYEQGLRDGMNQ